LMREGIDYVAPTFADEEMNEAKKIVDAYKMEEIPRGGRRAGLPKPRTRP
jgi:hypothetical protein